jgi:Glutathione S-transferase, N-terminal domain
MADILLHGAAGSAFVRKVRIVLSEKGLAYEHVQTIPVSNPPPGLPFPGDHTGAAAKYPAREDPVRPNR